jgi:hypothetical protein
VLLLAGVMYTACIAQLPPLDRLRILSASTQTERAPPVFAQTLDASELHTRAPTSAPTGHPTPAPSSAPLTQDVDKEFWPRPQEFEGCGNWQVRQPGRA